MNAPAEEILAAEAQQPAIRVRIAEEETALATVVFPIVVAALVALALLGVPAEAVRVAAALEGHQAWVARAVVVEGVAGNPACKGEFMKFRLPNFTARIFLSTLFAIICTGNFSYAQPEPAKSATTAVPEGQAFDTPQKAAMALIQAAGNFDVPALLKIFGPEGKDLVSTADPVRDKNAALAFAAKAQEKNKVTIDTKNQARAILSIGNDDWPLPVPIVRKNGKWYFDSEEGHDEIVYRRIGANELDAIQICRGFVEAQKEYATQIHDDSGVNQYAQKIMSTPGKQDGLYWKNADGTSGGPISEAVARAIQEGYSPGNKSGYHGYYFKVLKGQGPAARLGQLDYVINGIMIGGFALVAVPAEYRVTGVKTFIVSYDGIVYEKDLGSDSLNIAKNMELYNPDKTWRVTNDEWPDDVLAAN